MSADAFRRVTRVPGATTAWRPAVARLPEAGTTEIDRVPAELDYPDLMGHRGAALLAPENTLAGIAAAADVGCRWVEVDAMLSRDGIAVLHHDYLLYRSAGVRRRVESLSLDELGGLAVGPRYDAAYAPTGIPTLRDALALMHRRGLTPNVEIKPPPGRESETAHVVATTLAEAWPPEAPTPLLSSFSVTALRTARDVAPRVPRALIVVRPPRKWHAQLEALESDILHVSRKHLTAKRAESIVATGTRLGVYTVNDPAEARTFRSWGAHCIITDAPDVVDPWVHAPLPSLGPPPAD